MQPLLFNKKEMKLTVVKQKKNPRVYGLDSCFTFGKYAFRYIRWIISIDAPYLVWMKDKYNLTYTNELTIAIKKHLELAK